MQPTPRDVGDQSQRYCIEVQVQEREQMAGENVWDPGWHAAAYANKLDSAETIAKSFVTRPNWPRSRIVDRHDGGTVVKLYRSSHPH